MENKTSKYFKYAIGEIILVVIGILIALQINTWNENRKQNAKLKVILTSVYKDLVADSLVIHRDLEMVNFRVDNNAKFQKRIYSTTANLDTIVQFMKYEFPISWYQGVTYNTNTFSNLKSTGSFDILPEFLKKELSNYYTLVFRHNRLSTIYLDQYRKQLDTYLNIYNMVGRHHSNNYRNSFLFNESWREIDAKDFTARTAVLFGSYKVLYIQNQKQMNTSLVEIKKLMDLLKSNLND
ncbi:MAG: hypothetical protein JXQ93_06345 [Flavobacteriaceae bacterium]